MTHLSPYAHGSQLYVDPPEDDYEPSDVLLSKMAVANRLQMQVDDLKKDKPTEEK